MKQFFLFILFFVPRIAFAFGSGASVSGLITDEEKKPLQFAIITLLNSSDSSLVKGEISSAEGKFSFDEIASGNYFVRASLTGYDNYSSNAFALAEENLILPEIILHVSQVMNEVEISSAHPLFIQKPGMLIMDVENSPVRITGTAYDVVSRAPGVSVDQDGNFSLQGKPGVKIYVDGKPTYLSGDQLKSFLTLMPASDVVHIEIMTNPPAKYDAEGSAGIINVVTRKGTQQGFNGSVSGGLGYGLTPKSEAGISLNYGAAKYNVYSKYDFGTPYAQETKFVTRTVGYEGFTSRYNQDVNLLIHPMSEHLRIGADFFPSKKISWGVRADASAFFSDTKVDTRNTVTQVDSGLSNVLHQVNHLHGKFENASAGIYFKKEIDTTGTELSASFDYVDYYNRAHEYYNLHFFDVNGIENSPAVFQRTHKNTDIGIYVGQVDFSHPFHKKYKFEAGVKSSYVKTSNALLFETENAATNNWDNDPARSNTFIYTEQINAAYADISADYTKWQLEAGLRAEQTLSLGNSPTTNETHQNNYIQLFPTFFATQQISDKQSLQYSVSRRINRPAYDELNPFIFYVDQYTYHIGNPFLQPEISNSIDLTHDYGDFLFSSLGASRTTHGISQITRQIDSTGILNQSEMNLNTIDNIYLSELFSKQLTSWWNNEFNVIVNYNRYKSSLDAGALDKGNLVFNFIANETFSLKYNWKFELSASYQSPMVYALFYILPSADVTAGLSKNFLNNKLHLTITASDLFYWQTQHVRIDFYDQHLYAWHKFDTRVVYVRLRYGFGNSNAAKKSQFKNAADDLQKRAGK